MIVSEHAGKAARDLPWTHYVYDVPKLAERVQQAIDSATADLIRQGTGEAPVSEGELEDIRKDHEDYGKLTAIVATRDLLTLIDFLKTRIAFLCQDNESWLDGYQRGVDDGIRRAVGRLAEELNLEPEGLSKRVLGTTQGARTMSENAKGPPDDIDLDHVEEWDDIGILIECPYCYGTGEQSADIFEMECPHCLGDGWY